MKGEKSNTIKSFCRIPPQLQEFEIILMRKSDPKRPLHKWKEKRFKANDKIVLNHLRRGGGYAIFCDGIAVIDADHPLLLEAVEDLPETFTVRTGGGGYHFYYKSDLDKKIILWYGDDEDKEPEHLGEIQSGGRAYVIGPGSPHPSGNRYEIIKDLPLAWLSAEDIEEWIKKHGFRTKKKAYTKKEIEKAFKDSLFHDIPVTDFLYPDNAKSVSDGVQGAHPIHGSTTGWNLHVNTRDNVWYCHRCQAGGGPLEAFAVAEGIIDCSEAGPGCLQGDLFKEVLRRLEERGYKVPELKKKQEFKQRSLTERIKVEAMPEELPDADVICIIKPPRVGEKGGTHYAVKQLVKAGGGTYVTHRHEGVRHALDVLKKIDPEARAVVWVEGKYREGMCRTGDYNCKSCQMYPDEHKEDHISYFELDDIATKLLRKYKILKKEVIANLKPWQVKRVSKEYEGLLCPYYTLMAAVRSPECKYCFTVAHFIDREFIKPKLIVIDESQTVQHFYPRSVELAEVILDETDWHARSTLAREYIPRLRRIKERIEAKERKLREDKAILEIVNQFEMLNAVLKMGDSRKLINSDEIFEFIPSVNIEEYDTDPESVLEKITDYIHPDEYDPAALFEAVLYPFKKRLCWVKSDNNKRYTLYLIGDAEKPVLRTHNVLMARKLIVIGGIEAERFCKWLKEEGKQTVTYEITEFPFKRNFIVFPVNANGGEKKEKSDWEKKKQRRRNLEKIVKRLNKKDIPVIVWTGSKRKQAMLEERLGDNSHKIREWSVEDIEDNLHLILLGYANSRVARAVDMPLIDVCAIWDADFVSPYWYAVAEDAEEREDTETVKFAEFMHTEIVAEETTNMALRISPTPDDILNQPKVVLLPQDEVYKLRWISDRIITGWNGMKTEGVVDRITEIVSGFNLRKKFGGDRQFWKMIAEELKEVKNGYRLRLNRFGLFALLVKDSVWQKHVENDQLLTCLSQIDVKEGEVISEELFNVVKEIIIHVLKESKTRLNQERLVRKVVGISPIKSEGKIREILKRLHRMRIIEREKVRNAWMYSLR